MRTLVLIYCLGLSFVLPAQLLSPSALETIASSQHPLLEMSTTSYTFRSSSTDSTYYDIGGVITLVYESKSVLNFSNDMDFAVVMVTERSYLNPDMSVEDLPVEVRYTSSFKRMGQLNALIKEEYVESDSFMSDGVIEKTYLKKMDSTHEFVVVMNITSDAQSEPLCVMMITLREK